jgi:simple sugar transport system ATP-binding protein
MTIVTAPASDTVRSTTSIELRGITKRFGSLVALDHVDLQVLPGIHALIGENGAGKSTLAKALYGFDPPDSGEVLLDGAPVAIRSPRVARSLGIGMVFQQSTLIPAFTVAENIALYRKDLPRVLRWRAIDAQILALSEHYGLGVDPTARTGTLSLPELQRVEIVRLLITGARILILDEPTSTLPAQEIASLFDVFRRLRDEGYSIVFITHKLREVLDVADHVTVMRGGAVAGTMSRDEVTEDRLIDLMFHEDHRPAAFARSTTSPGPVVFALEDVSTRGTTGLRHVDLEVRAGELVGVAGISGEGQRELGDVAIGMLAPRSGRRLLGGRDASSWSVRKLRGAGVAYIPESVSEGGVIWNMTLAENVALANLDRATRDVVAIDWHRVRGEFLSDIESLGVTFPASDRMAMTLSGGNLQRFAVARELARNPQLLVALYPTRGLDARTTDLVRSLLVAARERGTAVLLVSQDLAELEEICDRIVVIRGGRIVGSRTPEEADAHELGRLMMGGDEH